MTETATAITASELRIGNWVELNYYRDKPENVIVQQIAANQLWVRGVDFNISLFLNNFSPIPLTPEILKTCGFEWEIYGHNGEMDVASCDLGKISISDEMVVWANHEEVEHIKYLHQLQNLYFALTGNELEINL
jgi:hypothetical protein